MSGAPRPKLAQSNPRCFPVVTVLTMTQEQADKISPCLLRAMSGCAQQFSRFLISTFLFHPYFAHWLLNTSPGTTLTGLLLKFHPSCLENTCSFLYWLMLVRAQISSNYLHLDFSPKSAGICLLRKKFYLSFIPVVLFGLCYCKTPVIYQTLFTVEMNNK